MNSIYSLIKELDFDPSNYDTQKEVSLFQAAIDIGLKKQTDDLLMIPTYLSVPTNVDKNEPIIVMDMGGTNVRVALVTPLMDGSCKIEHLKQYQMPGIGTPIDGEDFLNKVVDFLLPVKDMSKKIGICFSYEMEMLPNHDGKIIKFTKEVSVIGLDEKKLGEEIKQTLEKRGLFSAYQITFLNDTVATLLGGYGIAKQNHLEKGIGLIIGTGLNMAYMEEVERIKKLQTSFYSDKMIINMENGGYKIQHRSIIDNELDQESKQPGYHIYEKMVSGRYLGELAYRLVKKAVERKLFSDLFSRAFYQMDMWATYEIDEFLVSPYNNKFIHSDFLTKEDRAKLIVLLKKVFERAAYLTAIQLTSILEHMDGGREMNAPVFVITEGSTINKSKWVKRYLNYYMEAITVRLYGRHVEFLSIEHTNLMGSAISVYC